VTVFTSPTPLRTGVVDISVLLQDSATGQPVLQVPVEVIAHRVGESGQEVMAEATNAAATNKLLLAAPMELREPGRWEVEIRVHGPREPIRIRFDTEVGEAWPPWVGQTTWVAWPFVAVLVFCLHQRWKHGRPSATGG
jgi:hypothetical protein